MSGMKTSENAKTRIRSRRPSVTRLAMPPQDPDRTAAERCAQALSAPLSRIIYRHAHNCGARCDLWLKEDEDQGSGPRAQDDIFEKKWNKARIGCTMC